MGGIEVLDQDVCDARVLRQALQEFSECFESTSRCADSYNPNRRMGGSVFAFFTVVNLFVVRVEMRSTHLSLQ